MTKFVEVRVGDIVWLAVRFGDKVMKLYPSYRVGHCRRAGQRMTVN